MFSLDHLVTSRNDVHMLADMTDLEQTRLNSIVEIRSKISDLISQIDQLRLERRPLVQKILREIRMLLNAVVARVFDDALANAKRKIQPAMRCITLLKVLDDPQRMNVMVESPAVTFESAVQRTLSSMPKWRMTDVMNQRQRFGQILMQAERSRSRTSYLRYLDSVSQPAAEVVGSSTREHLRLPRKTPKGSGLHDALTIPLERSPRRPKRRRVHTSKKQIVRISDDRASMKVESHSQLQV
jgi:hypothetical protein